MLRYEQCKALCSNSWAVNIFWSTILKSSVHLFQKNMNVYTKIQRLIKLLSIFREDDDEDEVDDQSEETNDVNEQEPPRK